MSLRSRRRDRSRHFHIERLEDRHLMAADIAAFDGTGNNLLHPEWGSAGEDLLRAAAAQYADGVSTPGGANRPSARTISNAVSTETDPILSDRNLSAFIYAWGQFLDHDLDLTGTTSESFDIKVPKGDPQFDPNKTGTQVITLARSIFDDSTGTSADNPRQQINLLTAFLDGSVIYGSDAARATALRTLVGGRLKTSPGDLLPLNNSTFFKTPLDNANDAHIVPDNQLFVAGDVRANENIELTALQTLFVREHNRIAGQIAAANPSLSDEQIFQQTRAIVRAELQAITYNQWLPALLGPNALAAYRGYNPSVNPGITNEFSTAAFRVGHTLLGDDIEFLDNNGEDVHDPVALREAFFNPVPVLETGIDPILKYLATDNAREVDTQINDDVRNFLFGPPGAGGFDLAARNIQRGRDNGLADYNSTRAAYGLKPVTSFAQITSDRTLQAKLKQLYGNVNNIDLWVGGLAEDHLPGSSVGQTFSRIISDQFRRLRDGDRFWYERLFSGQQLATLRSTTLSDIIKRNTTLTNIQNNVFFFDVSISGRVFIDVNGNGRQDRQETVAAGALIGLFDADGVQVTTARTNRLGGYSFQDIHEPGTYTVRVLDTGTSLANTASAEVEVTRGGAITGIDLALTLKPRTPTRPRIGGFNPGGGFGNTVGGGA